VAALKRRAAQWIAEEIVYQQRRANAPLRCCSMLDARCSISERDQPILKSIPCASGNADE
jgi:hypothetical protein